MATSVFERLQNVKTATSMTARFTRRPDLTAAKVLPSLGRKMARTNSAGKTVRAVLTSAGAWHVAHAILSSGSSFSDPGVAMALVVSIMRLAYWNDLENLYGKGSNMSDHEDRIADVPLAVDVVAEILKGDREDGEVDGRVKAKTVFGEGTLGKIHQHYMADLFSVAAVLFHGLAKAPFASAGERSTLKRVEQMSAMTFEGAREPPAGSLLSLLPAALASDQGGAIASFKAAGEMWPEAKRRLMEFGVEQIAVTTGGAGGRLRTVVVMLAYLGASQAVAARQLVLAKPEVLSIPIIIAEAAELATMMEQTAANGGFWDRMIEPEQPGFIRESSIKNLTSLAIEVGIRGGIYSTDYKYTKISPELLLAYDTLVAEKEKEAAKGRIGGEEVVVTAPTVGRKK